MIDRSSLADRLQRFLRAIRVGPIAATIGRLRSKLLVKVSRQACCSKRQQANEIIHCLAFVFRREMFSRRVENSFSLIHRLFAFASSINFLSLSRFVRVRDAAQVETRLARKTELSPP